MSESLGIGSRIDHPKFGLGIVVNRDSEFYRIYFSSSDELKSISRDFDGLDVTEAVESTEEIDLAELKKMISKEFAKYMDNVRVVELGNKWVGGTMKLVPADPGMQSKEIPVSTFFHKVVMVRDRLRVLEQNINSHSSLNEEEKVHLQQYITRAYGSLTTFNVLFANKEDQFKGAGKS